MCLELWFALLLTVTGQGLVWLVWGTEVVLYGNSMGWDQIAVGDGAGESHLMELPFLLQGGCGTNKEFYLKNLTDL